MAYADRRFTYRLALPENRVRLRGATSERVIVTDLSATGSGLIVEPDDFALVTSKTATFELGAGLSFDTQLDPVRVAKINGHLRVGTRFQRLPVHGMRTLSQFLIRGFLDDTRRLERLLDDPRTLTTNNGTFIRRTLRRCLVAERRSMRVYDLGIELPLNLVVEHIGGSIEARADRDGLEEGQEYTFVLSQPGSVMYFRSRIDHRAGRDCWVVLPERLHQAGFRDSIRTPLEASAASVCFVHPRLSDGCISHRLLDLSARGFAFESNPGVDLLFPGDRLPNFQVEFDGAVYHGAGTIRGIAPHDGSMLYSCGVEITEFADSEQERSWRDSVFRLSHPRMVLPEPSRGARSALRVLETSGYIDLWANDAPEGIAERFMSFWARAPADVGRLLLLEAGGETIGTMAGNLLFPKTWLIHHFGVAREKRSGPVAFLGFAREIYAALMYVLQHVAALEYFVIYVEKDKRWTRWLYGDFVERYTSAEDSAYDDIRVFRCRPAELHSGRTVRQNSVEVRLTHPEELLRISRQLKRVLSPLEYDAFAYDESNIDLAAFALDCRARSYDRARHIFVALEEETPVAALVAESGEEGANLFGLMNRCTLLPLRSDGVSASARDALLTTAKTHYASLGKPVFLYIANESTNAVEIESLGYEFVSDGVRWIARRSVVPAWLTFVDNSLASRPSQGVT